MARLKHRQGSSARTRGVRALTRAGPRRADLPSLCLLAASLLCSAALGYVSGQDVGGEGTLAGSPRTLTAVDVASGRRGPEVDSGDGTRHASSDVRTEPQLGAARNGLRQISDASFANVPAASDPGTDDPVAGEPVAVDPVAGAPAMAEIGRLHAEILRLRVLFKRLADVAELEDGEFDLTLEPFDLPSVRGVADGLDLSIRALDPISTQSRALATVFDERRAVHDRRVGGEVAPGTVRSSGFGPRPSPLGEARRELHRGVDFAGEPGTPIRALADGIVTWSGLNGGYGNLVELDHGDGLRTRYAHNHRNLVALGGRVRKGQEIALLGSTGRSTGPHVHVEVRQDGVPLDPAPFVR